MKTLTARVYPKVTYNRIRIQLSTDETNHTRLVTKTRWKVQSRQGHFKSMFEFFAIYIPISHIPHIGDLYRIGGAIINKYHPTIELAGMNSLRCGL